jgi:GntR family transcriptional regulator
MSRLTQLSQRLHGQLGELIVSLSAGDRLPSEPQLAKQFGVSRATLREAMRTFETQGLVQRQQGVGTFVVHPSGVIETGLEALESIETLAKRISLPVRMGDYEASLREADPAERDLLGNAEVQEITRVIEAEGRPVAFLIDRLAPDTLSQGELQAQFTGSVLDLLLRRGEPTLGSSETEIFAVAAPPHVARALRIQRGDVLLCLQATLFALDGSVVDLSKSYFLPGYFRFHVIRRVETLTTTG